VREQNRVDHWSDRKSRNENFGRFGGKGYDLRLLCLNPTGCRDVVSADLTKYDKLWARTFSGVNTVIHLAGEPRPSANWDTVLPLNITLLLNVFEAMRQYGGSKMIYASSNWVMAGYRFSIEKITTKLPPRPVNPYGISKLFGERAGENFVNTSSKATKRSFLAFRIGYCQADNNNRPGLHMGMGKWGHEMWLSAVLNLMSNNSGMRWDIEETRRLIGYVPEDGHVAEATDGIRWREKIIRVGRRLVERVENFTASRKW
jgi:NAD+ dependent glucose-6-phosphate dehydrogenase